MKLWYNNSNSNKNRNLRKWDVYDDIEIEEPNHKLDYKYLKTLTKDEVENLVHRLKNNANNESIKEYVIQLVYGVNEFDDFEIN